MLRLGKMMGDEGSVHIQFTCIALPTPAFLSVVGWIGTVESTDTRNQLHC